jgi:DNA invertase Pin-like site-specific DNA recombinase
MTAYFAYIRVSTAKQGEQGSSLREQRDAIEAYARRHELQISAWFEETETAAKQGRRAFNRMLTELRRQQATGIILHKIDRGARNLWDWAHINDLIDAGFEVHSAHDSLDFRTRGGRLAADIQAVVAADYIRNLRDEVRKGIHGRLKQGYFPFFAPVGYLNAGAATAKTVDPVRAPLVVEAFERYASGAYTLRSLRPVMAERGLATRGGRPLAKSYLASMLANPFYIGVIRLRSGETFLGRHPALISSDLFERVQAVLEGRTTPRTQKHFFPYRGVVRCDCGRMLTGERQKGHVYYRCHGCRRVSIKETRLHAATAELFALVHLGPEELRDLGDLVTHQEADLLVAEAEAKREAKRRLEQSGHRLERLTDALIDGALDKAAFDARRSALLREQRAYRERVEAPSQSVGEQIVEKFERAMTAQLRPETLSSEQLRTSLASVGSNLVLRGNELALTLQFPFDLVAQWRVSSECGRRMNDVRTFPLDALMRTASGDVPQVPHVLVLDVMDASAGWRSRPEHGRRSQARVQAGPRTAKPRGRRSLAA